MKVVSVITDTSQWLCKVNVTLKRVKEKSYLNNHSFFLVGVHSAQALCPGLGWQSRRLFNYFGALHNTLPIGGDYGSFESDRDSIAIVRFREY